MKNTVFSILSFLGLTLTACHAQTETDTTKAEMPPKERGASGYNLLTPQQQYVILQKGTDRAFTGDYYNKTDKGLYICRQCNAPLYESDDKFESHCGWPSFDQEIKGSVIRVPDADGQRTEIICSNCKGHLGHVFLGEGFTDKDTRHCVNTSSLLFVPADKVKDIPATIKP